MNNWSDRLKASSKILRRQAVRIPLPDVEAERSFHQNMMRIAAAGERKSTLLDDPDVPLTEVYEDELHEMRQSFEHRLQQVAGEDYYDVATAYLDGERDDWIGALAAYYLECYYRLQEHYTVDEQIFFLAILRYPKSFTVNLSFLTGDFSADAVSYESSKHVEADLDEHEQEQLHADCQYSQHEAAKYIREHIDCIREAVPDPDTTPFEQRQYGGFVHITGRQGSTFKEVLEYLSPDPDRFDDEPSTPGLVPEGPEAKRAKETFLIDAEVVI
ncbi:Uncharacterized protein HSBGL_2530 [Halapricum desulfuricans]|uniref:Uncharacterized protein n=1 Tax=Halapricum desulfuricans TaxID=2841257 RepID=A0A897NKH3_9EURY|nr:hypothetical protein [Halapricum desulfuricans]QSG12934.1 Uncharacterized protein HSBGL_2530 [Halapricum desulfuricans]